MKYLFGFLIIAFSCNNGSFDKDKLIENSNSLKNISNVNEEEDTLIEVNSSEDECNIIKLVVDKVKEEEHMENILLERLYVKWNEEMYFEFKIDGYDYLPKTERERVKRLKSTSIADPYPIFYLFADLQLDAMFNLDDRNFMRSQISKNPEGFDCSILSQIPIASQQETLRNRIAVTKPLFNKHKTKAAIVVHWEHSYYNKELSSGIVQNFYLQKGKSGWKIIHATEIWLL